MSRAFGAGGNRCDHGWEYIFVCKWYINMSRLRDFFFLVYAHRAYRYIIDQFSTTLVCKPSLCISLVTFQSRPSPSYSLFSASSRPPPGAPSLCPVHNLSNEVASTTDAAASLGYRLARIADGRSTFSSRGRE